MAKSCTSKRFTSVSAAGCPTQGPSGAVPKVDLVILIDTSESMGDEAKELSDAAKAAIRGAATKCPADLRVEWLGIEGTWPDTKFVRTLRHYLESLGVADLMASAAGDREDGGPAISDLCALFDWRPGAARAIFYLGDEGLRAGTPQNSGDLLAADRAIADATENEVTVHMYAGTSTPPPTASEFLRVASGTGGRFVSATEGGAAGLGAALEEVICASRRTKCHEARIPRMQPCFEMRWGDGPHDRIETDDFEVLCITACNPYANVCFKDVTIVATQIVDAKNEPVKPTPDGAPSVLLKPSEQIHFGDLAPCKKEGASCVSREVVLKTSGAPAGRYRVQLTACFSVEIPQVIHDHFLIELVGS
ncbi:MAG: hypothetical protein R3B09_13280 [Nannocystaceae bacterium]